MGAAGQEGKAKQIAPQKLARASHLTERESCGGLMSASMARCAVRQHELRDLGLLLVGFSKVPKSISLHK